VFVPNLTQKASHELYHFAVCIVLSGTQELKLAQILFIVSSDIVHYSSVSAQIVGTNGAFRAYLIQEIASLDTSLDTLCLVTCLFSCNLFF